MAEPSGFLSDEDEFGALALRYLDGIATRQECELLRGELIASPERRRIVVSLCHRHGQLSELLLAQQQQTKLAIRTRPTFKVSRGVLVATAAALFIAVGVGKFFQSAHQFGVPIARFGQVQGEVYLADLLGQRIAATEGRQIRSGQGLQTVGDDSTAVLTFDDGTRLEIGADSVIAQLVGGGDQSKQVILTAGYLTADVARQPPHWPMLVSTPQAEVRVLGTRFILSGGDDITFVETREGRVQVTRKSDGNSIDLAAGDEAAVSQEKELTKSRSLAAHDVSPQLSIAGQYATTLSHDGRLMATSHYLGGEVELWDVATNRRRLSITPYRSRTTALAFSRDNQSLATGCGDQTVRFFNTADGQPQFTLEIKQGSISDLVYSPSGQELVVLSSLEGSDERQLSVWDLDARQQVAGSPWTIAAQRWAFSPRGDLLATAQQGSRQAIIWDLANHQPTYTLSGLGKNIFSLAFTHDSQAIAINDSGGTVTLRGVRSGEVIGTINSAGGRVFGMAFSPDEILLATGHQDGAVRVWSLGVLEVSSIAECAAVLRSDPCHIGAVTFSPEGSTLLTRAIRLATPDRRRDGIVQFWNVDAAIKANKLQSAQETP